MLRGSGFGRLLELSFRAPEVIWAILLLGRETLWPEMARTHLRHVKVVSIARIIVGMTVMLHVKKCDFDYVPY